MWRVEQYGDGVDEQGSYCHHSWKFGASYEAADHIHNLMEEALGKRFHLDKVRLSDTRGRTVEILVRKDD